MPKLPSMEEMLAAGVHFGHQSSRWHPKMKPFIFGMRSGIHIINLEETEKLLPKALDFITGVASSGGSILFVGTKPQARAIVKEAAELVDMPYVHNRWLGGTLTNFSEIKRLIKKFLDLKDQSAKGELKKYTKQEQLWFSRDIEDMDRKVGGIQKMLQTPDAIFIVDIKAEKTALLEARQKGLSVIALVDSNVNPSLVDYAIPANDDGIKAITMIMKLVTEAIQEGRAQAQESVTVKVADKDAEENEEVAIIKPEAIEEVAELDEEISEELAEEKSEEKTGDK